MDFSFINACPWVILAWILKVIICRDYTVRWVGAGGLVAVKGGSCRLAWGNLVMGVASLRV